MKVEMTIPDLSTTGGTVKVVSWLAEAGQAVKRGQPLLEVETDKSTMEVEAYLSGVLLEILAGPGADVEVGQSIAIIDTQEESRPVTTPVVAAPGTAKPEIESTVQAPTQAAPTARTGMFARNRQKTVQGGSHVEPARPLDPEPGVIPAPPALPMTAAQRVVAQRMLESKQTIPHFYLQISANASAMIARRSRAPAEKIAWDAFFVYAAGKALQRYPRMRASFREGQIIPQQVDAIGVAVDLGGDLFVISIANPAARSPEEVSAEIRAGVQRLQAGDQEIRKIRANNLTVTNLGATGVESFTAVINPPEAAILAVGKIAPAVVAMDGQAAVQERVTLTLSVDHRVVNGRYAAEFLSEIVRELENL